MIAATFRSRRDLAAALIANEVFVDVGEAWCRQFIGPNDRKVDGKIRVFSNVSKFACERNRGKVSSTGPKSCG